MKEMKATAIIGGKIQQDVVENNIIVNNYSTPKGFEEKRKAPFQSLNYLPDKIDGFAGRKTQLADVKRILSNKKLCIISGKPGFGKSSIAFKYCLQSRNCKQYGDIIILSCENIDTLKSSIGLVDVKDSDLEEVLDVYFDTCINTTVGNILFVFDNLGKDRYHIDTNQPVQSPDKLRDMLVSLIKRKYSTNNSIFFLITSIYDDLFYEKNFTDCLLKIEEFNEEEAEDYLTTGITFNYEKDDIDRILSTFSFAPIVLKTVKKLAIKENGYCSIRSNHVRKKELYTLLNQMLQYADATYKEAIQIATYCYKEDIPAKFLALCIKNSKNTSDSLTDIEDNIKRENNDYRIFDIYTKNGQLYYSIHQIYQLEIRKMWEEQHRSKTLNIIFNTFSEKNNFYSYYGISAYKSIKELNIHIETFWSLLCQQEQEQYKELWLHYRWIDEYFLSSNTEFMVSPIMSDRVYSLRFTADRLSNQLENSDFDRRHIIDFYKYLYEDESISAINKSLQLRARLSFFFIELLTNQEAECIENLFLGKPLKDFINNTLAEIDSRIAVETDNPKIIFWIEHACMLRSMCSIEEIMKRSPEAHKRAVKLNDDVFKILGKYSCGSFSKLPASYDKSYLYYIALNYMTLPQWESPEHFCHDTKSITDILENAYEKTKECADYYIKVGFYEMAEVELGNLFDICGSLAKEYKTIDSEKSVRYLKESEDFLNRRLEIREQIKYLSPEFMHSFLYKKYLFFTQYSFASPEISNNDKKKELLLKAKNTTDEWEKWKDKTSSNNQAIFYRMKGILYRKLIDMGCYESEEEKHEYFDIANQCFDSAINRVPNDTSVLIVNTVEKAFVLKAFGKIYEAKKVLESIEALVRTTGAWEKHYTNAVMYTNQEILSIEKKVSAK